MRVKILSIVFAFLLTAAFFTAFSQPGNGNGNGKGPPRPCPPNNPNCQPTRIPITSGVLVLLAGGIGFGIRTISRRRKQN